jgi:Lar family restriction alleviation protein
MDVLKPCPFCGGEAMLYRMKRDSRKRMGIYHMIATVKCTECTAQVSQAGYCEERAIENAYHQWNRREEDATD